MAISKQAWMWWAIGAGGAFFALEIPAIVNSVSGDTLSEYVWAMDRVWRIVIIGGLAWLIAHFGWRV